MATLAAPSVPDPGPALRRFQALPRSQPLSHTLTALYEELSQLLAENEHLRDEVTRLEIRIRGTLRGR